MKTLESSEERGRGDMVKLVFGQVYRTGPGKTVLLGILKTMEENKTIKDRIRIDRSEARGDLVGNRLRPQFSRVLC